MKTRIRYKKKQVVLVKLESAAEFEVQGNKMSVDITEDHGFWITLRDLKKGPSFLKGPYQTLPIAQKAVKELLLSMGVVFEEETRDRASKSKKLKKPVVLLPKEPQEIKIIRV